MVTHRYVGVVMGLLMLLWFASGVVMLFVHWPEVSGDERAAGLPPIRWERCCVFGDMQDVRQVSSATVEDLAGRPVLRLDGDYYESTRDALTSLYDKVSPGGYIIVDDYGEDRWTYCRKAVDEFRAERGIADPMQRVDAPCAFWCKSGFAPDHDA